MDLYNKAWEKFAVFSDEQRLQRLQQCQDLTLCARNCIQVQEERLAEQNRASSSSSWGTKPTKTELIDLEDCVAGIRMMKYFGWRESAPVRRNPPEGGSLRDTTIVTTKKQGVVAQGESEIPSCARQVHAMWGCRAVSLACSNDVIRLRNCFREIDDPQAIISVSHFAYQPEHLQKALQAGVDVPCREWQEAIGKCVATKAADLEARVMKTRANDAAREAEQQQ